MIVKPLIRTSTVNALELSGGLNRWPMNNYYYFPGHNRIGFYTDTIGQHILLFVIDSKVSNAIVIDVVSYQPPVYQQPVYSQPSYVSPIYYREIYEPTIHVYPGRHRENVSPIENGHDHPHRGNASPNEHWFNWVVHNLDLSLIFACILIGCLTWFWFGLHAVCLRY